MKHKITIYLNEIYFNGQTVNDPMKMAKIIHSHIKHLGEMTTYVTPKPKTFWQKLLKAFNP